MEESIEKLVKVLMDLIPDIPDDIETLLILDKR